MLTNQIGLLDPFSRNRFLRDRLGFRQKWWYYLAMVLDPLIRFNFILYVIFVFEAQHSSVMSFIIGLSEVFRRGFWSLFRLENEHCTKFVSSPPQSMKYTLTHPWCRTLPSLSRNSSTICHPLLEVFHEESYWNPDSQSGTRREDSRADYSPRQQPVSLLAQLQKAYLSKQLSSKIHVAAEERHLQLNRDRSRNHLQIRLITEPYLEARRGSSFYPDLFGPEDDPLLRRAVSVSGKSNKSRSSDGGSLESYTAPSSRSLGGSTLLSSTPGWPSLSKASFWSGSQTSTLTSSRRRHRNRRPSSIQIPLPGAGFGGPGAAGYRRLPTFYLSPCT